MTLMTSSIISACGPANQDASSVRYAAGAPLHRATTVYCAVVVTAVALGRQFGLQRFAGHDLRLIGSGLEPDGGMECSGGLQCMLVHVSALVSVQCRVRCLPLVSTPPYAASTHTKSAAHVVATTCLTQVSISAKAQEL